MGKKIVVLILIVAIPTCVFAINLSDRSQTEIYRLTEAAKGMSQSEAMLLSQTSQMRTGGPFALNFLLGETFKTSI